MAKLRVLVVDDSVTVRKHLVELLEADPEIEVVGEAGDGKSAIELCRDLRPDVLTLDMMLPVMTGLAVTEYVMAHFPTPILIVSASVNRGELFHSYDALAAGAVEWLEKAPGHGLDGEWEQLFLRTVKLVSRIKVITHLRGRMTRAAPVVAPSNGRPPGSTAPRVVAIGASTGGPGAVSDLLRGLPPKFPLPILLVIHIGPLFATAFADWLDGQSHLRVSYANDGELLPPVGEGRVLMAPPGRHLVLRDRRLWLSDAPERHSCRPSVDALFESVATDAGAAASACLLTGMGRDGAAGLLAVRRAGGATIAQDEASSVVFGMPREAILLGAAQRILPLDEIPRALASLALGTVVNP